MSKWSDRGVLEKMAALDEKPQSEIDKFYAQAYGLCDEMDRSPDIGMRTLSRVARVLSRATHDAALAVEKNDHATAFLINEGIIVAMAGCLASLLENPDEEKTRWAQRTFEDRLNGAVSVRAQVKEAEKR